LLPKEITNYYEYANLHDYDIARKSIPKAEQCIPQQQEGTKQEEQERSQILQESWTR
jgi:hypothetical protein